MKMEFPPDFKRRIRDLYGPDGTRWLENIPRLIRELEQDWAIRVSDPLPDLNYNYLAPARCADGREAFLKLGVPGDELKREIAALQAFDGRGAAELWAQDAGRGALLLARVRPGTDLKGLPEGEAVQAAAGVMVRLHRAPPAGGIFPTVDDWGAGFRRCRQQFAGGAGPLPAALVREAEAVFNDLARSSGEAVLLHGDLHHENLLADSQGWRAIDPKGVLGEPAYEVGAFLRNPLPEVGDHPDLPRLMRDRVEAFAALLALDRERIAAWGFAQAVLSAVWSVEDHGGGWEPAVKIARALQALKGQ